MKILRGSCVICFSENMKTLDIKHTYLGKVFEKLVDININPEGFLLCNICCTRLKQCHLLIKQTNLQNIQDDCVQTQKALVNLTTHHIDNVTVSAPYNIELVKKEPKVEDQRYFTHEVVIKREKQDSPEYETTQYDVSTEDFCEEKTQNFGENKNDNVEDQKPIISAKIKKRIKDNSHKPLNDEILCYICGKFFANKYTLVVHEKSHTGEKSFSCEICHKKFTLLTSLKIHKRSHTGEKPFSCKKCGKKFNTSGYLIKHMRTHTGDKPYGCDTCGKRFRQKNDLTTHNRIHTGEKPYECKVCFTKFSDNSHLARHRKRLDACKRNLKLLTEGFPLKL